MTNSDLTSTARLWQIEGTPVCFGIIASVTEPFCGHCNRLRLTADGKLRPCLFGNNEYDIKTLLRNQATDDDIKQCFIQIVRQKEERHHIGEEDFTPPQRTMSRIGG